MGQVFRAERLATGQTVAIKLLHPEFSGVEQVVQRFEREAKVTTQLSHPNIVKMFEFGEWNGRLFLAMEFLPGTSLAQLIERLARCALGGSVSSGPRDHRAGSRRARVRARGSAWSTAI